VYWVPVGDTGFLPTQRIYQVESLTRIFHEYATINPVADMIAGIVAFTRKDCLYQALRLPNANVF